VQQYLVDYATHFGLDPLLRRDLWNVFYFVFIKHPLRKRLGIGRSHRCAR